MIFNQLTRTNKYGVFSPWPLLYKNLYKKVMQVPWTINNPCIIIPWSTMFKLYRPINKILLHIILNLTLHMIISKLELKILAMIPELPSWSEIYPINIPSKTWLNKLISILPILMTFFIYPVILKYFFS